MNVQHVVQRVTVPELLTANWSFSASAQKRVEEAGLQWSDIPIEREARAVAKRICSHTARK